MIASDIQRKTDKKQGLAVFLGYLYYFFAAKTDVGALSTLFCATSPDAAAHPGKMWSAGPDVKLDHYKNYKQTFCEPAFTAINAAIQSKGSAGFRL